MQEQTQLLRMPDVRRVVGLSRTEIYRRMKDGRFPKPVPLGTSAIAWSSAELQAWIEQRIAERDSALEKKAA